LVRSGRVALFLDGLDEMPPVTQSRALRVIDRDAIGLSVVLTSHPDEFRAAVANGRLYGAAVVDILPVDVHHAEAFLPSSSVSGVANGCTSQATSAISPTASLPEPKPPRWP
jgi:hypothetical protein